MGDAEFEVREYPGPDDNDQPDEERDKREDLERPREAGEADEERGEDKDRDREELADDSES